jgi:hypothetical protein
MALRFLSLSDELQRLSKCAGRLSRKEMMPSRPSAVLAATAPASASSVIPAPSPRPPSIAWDDLVDETPPFGDRCVYLRAGEYQLLRAGHADQTGQALGSPPPRDGADLHLGRAELGAVRCNPQVARKRQFETAAEGHSVQRDDRRLA